MKNKFTTEQEKAVFSLKGEFVVKASAGTGKTHVLVNRFIHLYHELVNAGLNESEAISSILTVTFTKKAAKEMLHRIAGQLPPAIMASANILTIDSFCAKFIKENAFSIGHDPDFKMMDEIQSKLFFLKIGRAVLNSNIDWALETDQPINKFLSDCYQLISTLKQRLILPQKLLNMQNADKLTKTIGILYEVYENRLKSENLMDFGRLLFSTYSVIKNDDITREKIQKKYQYVMVDEYQDTNLAQIELLKLIAAPQNNFFAVGDEKQSIYAFRGAYPEHICNKFTKLSQNSKTILSRNFRSAEPLPALVNAVFNKKLKEYTAINGSDDSSAEIELYTFFEREKEAEYIALKIKELLDQGYKHSDIVVLMRGVKNSHIYEDAIKKINIDAVTIGGGGFYKQAVIKDVLAYLSVIDNPNSDKDLVRLLRAPAFAFKNSELAELAEFKEKKGSLYQALKKSHFKRHEEILEFILYFNKKRYRNNVVDIIEELLEKTGLMYRAISQPGAMHSRDMNNLNKFKDLARQFTLDKIFSGLSDFIDYMRAIDEIDIVETEAHPVAKDVITIMSIHQSKGLEFPFVFLANISPLNMPGTFRASKFHYIEDHPVIVRDDNKESKYSKLLKPNLLLKHKNEELRLLYVAMTRSSRNLIISGCLGKRDNASKFMEFFLKKEGDIYIVNPELEPYLRYKDNPELPKQKQTEQKMQQIIKNTKLKNPDFGFPVFTAKKQTIDNISVTQLEAYAKCPMYFYFKYIQKFPERPNMSGFSPALFGTAVHYALESFYTKKQSNIKENIVSYIIASGITSNEYKNHYNAKVDQIVKNVLQMDILPDSNEIVFIEQTFSIRHMNCNINGTIDRVDNINGSYKLVDYKTSKNTNPDCYLLQMSIYAAALKDIFDIKISSAEILFLMEEKIRLLTPTKSVWHELENIIKGILKEDFFCSRDSKCAYCSYNNLCTNFDKSSREYYY